MAALTEKYSRGIRRHDGENVHRGAGKALELRSEGRGQLDKARGGGTHFMQKPDKGW